MKWIEIIKVQTAGSKASKACRNYLEQIELVQDETGPEEIMRYQNASISGFHLVMLHWTMDFSSLSISHQAQLLIGELKHFGMVDHSVWIQPDF